MIELNKVLLMGRLTRDPELRYIPSGTAVCKLRLAADRTYSDKNSSERQKETLFIDVDAWGKTAEFCNEYMKKGSAVYVEGRLKLDSWKDKETGKDVQKVAIVADRVQFGETKAEAQARAGRAEAMGEDSPRSGAPAKAASPAPSGESAAEPHDDLPF